MGVRHSIAVVLVALAVANSYGQGGVLQDWPTWRARTIALIEILGTNVAVSLDRFVRGFTKWCDLEPGHIRESTWADAESLTWLELEWTGQVTTLSIPEYVP